MTPHVISFFRRYPCEIHNKANSLFIGQSIPWAMGQYQNEITKILNEKYKCKNINNEMCRMYVSLNIEEIDV